MTLLVSGVVEGVVNDGGVDHDEERDVGEEVEEVERMFVVETSSHLFLVFHTHTSRAQLHTQLVERDGLRANLLQTTLPQRPTQEQLHLERLKVDISKEALHPFVKSRDALRESCQD